MGLIKEKRISTVIHLSRQAFGRYKLQIIILVILGILSGFLEGIGINALIPFFSLIVGDSAPARPSVKFPGPKSDIDPRLYWP